MPHFTKSVLSQYLRTRCEKQLFLSLHSRNELVALQLPAALKLRPQIQLVTARGRDWEAEKYQELFRAFPNAVSGLRPDGTKRNDVDLRRVLDTPVAANSFVVEGTVSHQDLQQRVAASLRMSAVDAASLPPFGDFRPDVVWLREPTPGRFAISSSGLVIPVSAADLRIGLTVIDVKHAATGNASYNSEVTLYAFILANWLELTGLSARYLVSDNVALWTRPHTDAALPAVPPGATIDERVNALMHDVEWVPSLQFLPTVREFLSSTLPKVVQKRFTDLEWHVDGRCSACDWLAQPEWLTRPDDIAVVEQSEHYCHAKARRTGHLSRIATLGRGARRALQSADVATVADLADLQHDALAFKTHNRLRADARALPIRARSVAEDGQLAVIPGVRGDIARYAQLQVFVSVNFDASADLLTGIGLRGYFRHWTPFGTPAPDTTALPGLEIVVDEGTLASEQTALVTFLQRLADYFRVINDPARGGPNPGRNGTQIYFWDERQYEELTRAIGRHLGLILNAQAIRGLAWLFPPEDLLQSPENSETPAVAFVKPAVLETVAANVAHAYTLFNVARVYHVHPPAVPSNYFRDPLSDMIPRERIYEIWHRTTQPVGWQDVLQRYRTTIAQQVAALAQITWRLTRDTQCRGQAPVIRLNGLVQYRGMSPDSRVWFAWALLEDNLTTVEAKLRAVGSPERQEASYDCIRFGRLIRRAGSALTFQVAEDSVNSKLSEGEDFLALRCDDIPAFLLLKAYQLPGITPANYLRNWAQDCGTPNYRTFGGVSLIQFNRVTREATIQLNDWNAYPDLRRQMEASASIAYDRMRWSLVKGMGVNTADGLREVLLAIGNPAIARAHPATLRIYGQTQQPAAGRSRVAPAARLMWEARQLHDERAGIPEADFDRYLTQFGIDLLDDSQRTACRAAASRSLALIWGPPGTGKTTTLSALLVCELLHAVENRTHLRVLVTGPTYKALKELAHRLGRHLDRLGVRGTLVSHAFSASRAIPADLNPAGLPGAPILGFHLDRGDANFATICQALLRPAQPTVVFATPRQALRLVKSLHQAAIGPTFDRCVLDESSQVTVADALVAFGGLADGARVTIAGDSLQLPPIAHAQAPEGAEFMVGSIHSYFKRGLQIPEERLLRNYRSASEFVSYAHTLGYDSQLRAHSARLEVNLTADYAERPAPAYPQTVTFGAWVGAILAPTRRLTTVLYDDGISGQHNVFEAQLVAALCVQLRSCLRTGLHNEIGLQGQAIAETGEAHSATSFWERAIGVVTPHRSQRTAVIEALRRAFPHEEWGFIEASVDTVEKFQGGERDVVIVSFGVGDPDLISDEEEFLLQQERMNVAVSRARAKCISVISRDLAYHLPESKRAVETSLALKSFSFDVCSESASVECTIDGRTRVLEVRTSVAPAEDEQ